MKKTKVKGKFLLDVGAGPFLQDGYVGMDKRALPGIDIVHDMEVFPWPLEDNLCHVIKMTNIVEHIKPWLMIDVINEVWRVMKDKGVLLISTPYAGNYLYWQDPTHCCGWNETTAQYFTPEHDFYQIYQPKPWKIERLTWDIYGFLEVAYRKQAENPTVDTHTKTSRKSKK